VKTTEIRNELLRQHGQVRALMASTRACAKQVRAGLPAAAELRTDLLELSNVLRTHHLQEEALLRDMLVNGHPSGGDDAVTLCEAHIQEHARMNAALKSIQCAAPEVAGVGIVALVDWIGQHMDREEVVFLAEDVFRDEASTSAATEG
jgi:hypothetical protein